MVGWIIQRNPQKPGHDFKIEKIISFLPRGA